MTWRIPVGYVEPGPCKEVGDVLRSGWFSPGSKVAEFEKRFAEIHDVPHAIFVNSGTDALRIALSSLKEHHGWKDGDEVIVPALTFVATVNIILQVGLKPVFVDVHSQSYVLEDESFLKAVTPKTRCVIPVHLFGLPCNMPVVGYHAGVANLRVIEDSCECMGVGFLNQWGPETGISQESKKQLEGQVGSFGDFGCFSTYACHLIVTGVGGLITSHSYELDQLARSYANHGRDPFFLGGQTGIGKDPKDLIKRRFTYERVGYSSRVSEFEAAVGIPQLKSLKENVHRRNVIAKVIETELPPMDFQMQWHPVNRSHAHMMFPIVLTDDSIDRDEFCYGLEQKGIETRPLFPLLTQPVYQKLWPGLDEKYPIAKRISERGFYVGCHPGMTDKDIEYLTDTLKAQIHKEVSVAA
jgi:dTDP-4-amino-4,6-dideoxygalactose transaminase